MNKFISALFVVFFSGSNALSAATPVPLFLSKVDSLDYKKGLILTTAFQKMDRDTLQKSMSSVGLWVNPRKDWKASWFYNYSLDPDNLFHWSAQSGVEFVPMFNKDLVELPNTEKCSLSGSGMDRGVPRCDVAKLSRQLKELKQRYEKAGGRPVSSLLGFNEPYGELQSNISPDLAAGIYRDYLIPIAKENKLRLGSPSFVIPGAADGNNVGKGFRWFLEFLEYCYQDKQCDVDSIQILAIHNYDCRGSQLDALSPGGFFFEKLVDGMVSRTGAKTKAYWKNYFNQRKVWVTETNCNHTNKGKDRPDNSSQACMMSLGQGKYVGDIGSLRALNKLEMVERYAWWTVHNEESRLIGKTQVDNERMEKLIERHGTADLLTDDGMALTPVGKAYRYFDAADQSLNYLCR